MKRFAPIAIAATSGALALALFAAPASAECPSSRPYVQDSDWSTPVRHTNYQRPVYNNDQHRLTKKRKRMVRRIMRRLDYNRDGYISRGEARYSSDMRRKFRRIDRNRDGYIGRWELNKHLRKVQRRAQRRVVYR